MSDFNRRVEQEIPRLRRYARALARSADRADDLVQETLLRAIAKAHLWQPGTDLRAWLFTIMHNHYVNMVRRAARDGATVDIEQVSRLLVANTDPTASRQLRELERGLACLPAEQREVILLVGLEGMSYETARPDPRRAGRHRSLPPVARPRCTASPDGPAAKARACQPDIAAARCSRRLAGHAAAFLPAPWLPRTRRAGAANRFTGAPPGFRPPCRVPAPSGRTRARRPPARRTVGFGAHPDHALRTRRCSEPRLCHSRR